MESLTENGQEGHLWMLLRYNNKRKCSQQRDKRLSKIEDMKTGANSRAERQKQGVLFDAEERGCGASEIEGRSKLLSQTIERVTHTNKDTTIRENMICWMEGLKKCRVFRVSACW